MAFAALLKGWFGKLFGSSVASMLCLGLIGDPCCVNGHPLATNATFQPTICTAFFATDRYITKTEDAGKVALFRSYTTT
jgi:hypothetical protein